MTSTARCGSGFYRRYVLTTVLAHWSTVKPAYRIVLEDGTQLVSSGDHRFLTERGWKHVTGTEYGGLLQRPHLTVNNKLMGVGGFAEPPKETAAYRRGYLCGMIRGDGTIGHSPIRARRIPSHTYAFRLALTDPEGLARTADYLARVGIGCAGVHLLRRVGHAPPDDGDPDQQRDQVRTIEWLIGWPDNPGADWRKGFLAGIFDAEGSYSGCLRIRNTDPAINGWIVFSLEVTRFRFRHRAVDRPNASRPAARRARRGAEVLPHR